MTELDEDIRASCFSHLEILWAEFGDDMPYVGGLNRGFPFRGHRIPFLNYQKGIYRASVQRGPAALSINTSYRSPYADEATEEGFSTLIVPERLTSLTTAHSVRHIASKCPLRT